MSRLHYTMSCNLATIRTSPCLVPLCFRVQQRHFSTCEIREYKYNNNDNYNNRINNNNSNNNWERYHSQSNSNQYAQVNRQTPIRLPPLSILSWSVDAGNLRSHSHCRRRLSVEERIPHIVQIIHSTSPDIVALQRSCPAIIEALCNNYNKIEMKNKFANPVNSNVNTICKEEEEEEQQPKNKENQMSEVFVKSFDNTEVKCRNDELEVNNRSRSNLKVRKKAVYKLIASARNGNSGELQMFVNTHSKWEARMLSTGFGVNAELTLKSNNLSPSHIKQESEEQSQLLEHNYYYNYKSEVCQNLHGTTQIPRCVISNVDLGFRGKSIGFDGTPLTNSLVSREGGAFTLRTEKSNNKHHEEEEEQEEELQQQQQQQQQQQRNNDCDSNDHDLQHVTTLIGKWPKAKRKWQEGDVHRRLAIEHLIRTTSPDIVVGNFHLLSKNGVEVMPNDYTDAWRKANSPAKHELTTNTHKRSTVHKFTNFFYFVASPFVKPRSQMVKEVQRAPSEVLHVVESCTFPSTCYNNNDKSSEEKTNTDDKSTLQDSLDMLDRLVGQPIPLHAVCTQDGKWLYKDEDVQNTTNITTTNNNSNIFVNSSSSSSNKNSTCNKGKDIEEHFMVNKESHETWVDYYMHHALYRPTMGTPEVASRFQRCYLREHVSPSISNTEQQQQQQQYSHKWHTSLFAKCYKRCRVLVLQHFVKVHIGPKETEWLKPTRKTRGNYINSTSNNVDNITVNNKEAKTNDVSEEVQSCVTSEKSTATAADKESIVGFDVRCGVSDEYPLLTLLS